MSKAKKMQNKKTKTNKTKIIIISTILLISVIISIALIIGISKKSPDFNNKSGDLVIDLSKISDKAKFYPVKVDGTKMEVIAVKAPDGTIRTAFNTCQVCYSSGRGYYKQTGNVLVCQNCGNRFGMNDVGVISGGCNPVPITDEDRTVTDTTITISADYLSEARTIFANWKN